MSKVRVAGFSVSLDGFSAGIEQSLSDPLGKRGAEIFQWYVHTQSFRSMHGQEGGSAGDIDDEFAHRAMDNFGAFILGRNMFGPVRGAWPDNAWKGWWGDNPPYHAPTFVLTHYEREPVVMEGGTPSTLLLAESKKRPNSRRKPEAAKMSRSEAACQQCGSV